MEHTVASVRPKWLALAGAAVLLGLVLRVSWLTEDAYITLRTVDNWVHGYGLRWNVDERVQAYTHPLWMLLLSACYAITREAFVTTIALGVLTTGAAVLTVVHYARSAGHALVAVVLLTLSRGFLEFSTSGLENPLCHLLIALFVGLYAVRRSPLWQLALLAALLLCTRMDAILVLAPALALASLEELRTAGLKPTLRALALGLTPWLAWEAFSLFYYGFPVPNTAYAKLNTGLPRGEVVAQGLVYWVTGLAWDPALHAVALAGVASACMRRRPRELALALGLLLYTLYVINIGGDFMQGRFWTIPFFSGVCLIAISELPLSEPARAAALLAPFALLFVHPLAKEVLTRPYAHNGVADERAVYRDGMSLALESRGEPMPTHAWAQTGRELAGDDERLTVQQNVGIMGFYAGPGVHIIDALALTDALLARLPMRYERGWRVGHYVRTIPNGYRETVLAQSCRMKDPQLCAYWQHLHEVIAGPLLSPTRLGTIVRMNLGAYDGLIDRERYRNPELKHARLDELSEPVVENASWDASGTLPVASTGLTIELPAPSHAARLELSFDGNDGYDLKFLRGTQALGQLSSPAEPRGGMRTRALAVPPQAHHHGFDRIVVVPFAGDQLYSIGYLRLFDP